MTNPPAGCNPAGFLTEEESHGQNHLWREIPDRKSCHHPWSGSLLNRVRFGLPLHRVCAASSFQCVGYEELTRPLNCSQVGVALPTLSPVCPQSQDDAAWRKNPRVRSDRREYESTHLVSFAWTRRSQISPARRRSVPTVVCRAVFLGKRTARRPSTKLLCMTGTDTQFGFGSFRAG